MQLPANPTEDDVSAAKALAELFRSIANVLDPPKPPRVARITASRSDLRVVPRNFKPEPPEMIIDATCPEDMALEVGPFTFTDNAGKTFTPDPASIVTEISGDVDSYTYDPATGMALGLPTDDGVAGGVGTLVLRSGNARHQVNLTLDAATAADASASVRVVPRPTPAP